MAINSALKQQLQGLIGHSVRHRGTPCRIIELLESEAALVLQADGERGALQDTQYGNPGRRVAEVFTIPLFDEEEPRRFHHDLLALGLVRSE